MKPYLFCLASVVLFSSCATIVTGSQAELTIDGNVDGPVTIQTSSETYRQVSLPRSIQVPRRTLKDSITLTVDSAESVSWVPGERLNNWFWGNLLGPGLVGMLIDGITMNAERPRFDTFFVQQQDSLGKRMLTVESYPLPKSRVSRFYRHEMGLSLGFVSNVGERRMDRAGDFLEQRLGYTSDALCNYFGPVSLGLHYSYYLNRQWAVGFEYAYAYGYSPYSKWNEETLVGYCDVRMHSHLLMAALKWQWLDYAPLVFYSKTAFGLQHRHVYCSFDNNAVPSDTPDDKRWLPAYQISPLCMELGRNRVRFFMELGYGNQGVFSMGINTKL